MNEKTRYQKGYDAALHSIQIEGDKKETAMFHLRCANLKETNDFTKGWRTACCDYLEEIESYTAGFTTGAFEEVKDLSKVVWHNALNQLEDDQDGIKADLKRRPA